MPIDRDKVYGVILAGGLGTRLWPLSRSLLPKHLLPLNGEEKTLLQQAAARLLPSVPPERIRVVANESQKFEVLDQLKALNPGLAGSVLAEPQANNTLPAIAWAVADIARKDSEALIGVFPSDHAIKGEENFRQDLSLALEAARQGYLVTFGIPPTAPETGYGYIRFEGELPECPNTFRVSSFVEKPDRETAEAYLKSGRHCWNSGIFCFRADVFLRNLEAHAPAIHAAAVRIAASPDKRTLEDAYKTTPGTSIDYGLMEKADRAAMVPARFEWSDLGSWEALYRFLEKPEQGNVVQGEVIDVDTRSSLLISKKGLLAAVGLADMVVVQTGDAVLVAPRSRAQDVKKVVDRLRNEGSRLADVHPTVARPWGQYTVLEEGPGYKIKRIVVGPRQSLSLQSHKHRAEHWVVVQGTARVTNGRQQTVLRENESTYIPKGETHRLENPGDEPLTLIEVQTGAYLGEDDIIRFNDAYGRTSEG